MIGPGAEMPSGVPVRASLRWRRLAEMVADQIRDRILSGELTQGELLPKESELREQYPVNVQSLREAMRILEAEGLVKVRRGNRGGAAVHRPTPGNVAYSLSMVLAMSGTGIGEVGDALNEVEPLCAALCAERSDRANEVVPILRRLHEESLACIDDLAATTAKSREFHEAIVRLCGSQPLIVMVGALEALWSSHVTGWANKRADSRQIPWVERREALDVHGQILKCIEDGDSATARELTVNHLREVQTYPQDPNQVDTPLNPAIARDRLFFD